MQPLTLITGSSGFLGNSFLKENKFKNITLLLRNKSNCNHHQQNSIIYGDLSSEKTLELIGRKKFSKVIHFSWSGLPVRNKHYNQLNLHNTLKLINVLLESNPNCELNFMGSCLEYGDLEGMVSESSEPNNPGDFGETKLRILKYIDNSTKNYRWFRIFYVYGFGQHANSLINYSFNQLRSNKFIKLQKPNQVHDYIHIGDVTKLISLSVLEPKLMGIINIGTGTSTSNSQIISELAKQMDVKYFESQVEKSRGFFANTSKILNFFPDFKFMTLEKGIGETLNALQK